MTPSNRTLSLVDQHLDRKYLIDTLIRLLQIPTEVPLGSNTLMEPDDPKLVHYVQKVIRPELQTLGCYNLIDAPLNQLVVELGTGEADRALLIMVYTPTQHNNWMSEPFTGKIANPRLPGFDEPCAFGQGASQNKAHMAAMLAVLKLLNVTQTELRGKLYFAINNEGRSSHACSDAILSSLERRPDACLILIGIDRNMKISLGNRGRVDIYIHVHGKAAHSSNPSGGLSAIDGANRVLNRLNQMHFPDTHPQLGTRHAVAYQIVYDPLAPHTLPGYAKLTIDRRLLPGDSIQDAVEQVREVIGDLSPFAIHVEPGVYMLPALVAPDAQIVTALQTAVAQARGAQAETMYLQSSFDAGGPCAQGVPTVMWGVSGNEDLLGDDFVALADVVDEARVLACLILDMLDAKIQIEGV